MTCQIKAAATSSIDLTPFCDPEWPKLAQPWVRGGFRYGCNGRIAARVPAPGEPDTPLPEDRHDAPPDIANLFVGNASEVWLPLPELPQCERCRSTGRLVGCCPDCRGSGECECDCGDRHDCATCEGEGRCGQLCSCHDDRQFNVELGRAWFKCRFLWLVARLPGCEYLPTIGEEEPVRLRFAGGEAVCMPVLIDDR